MKNQQLRVIDGGSRYLARCEAASMDASLDALDGLLDGCPENAYPIRCVLQKSSHGARVSVKVIFQARGMPLESVADRNARMQRGAARDEEKTP